jgi:hypothetical protein
VNLYLEYDINMTIPLTTMQVLDAYLTLGGAFYDIREFGTLLMSAMKAQNPLINWRCKRKLWRVRVKPFSAVYLLSNVVTACRLQDQ